MRHPRVVIPIVLAATALVAGCAGASAPSPSPAAAVTPAPTTAPTPEPTAEPTPEPTPSPTPEPTPDLEAIGAAYLAVAEQLTAAAQGPIDTIAEGGSYAPDDWSALHEPIADAYAEAIQGLDAIEFPDEVAADIAEMRAIFVDLQALFTTVVEDGTLDIWDEFIAKAEAYGALADRIRAELGLPPRPTPAS